MPVSTNPSAQPDPGTPSQVKQPPPTSGGRKKLFIFIGLVVFGAAILYSLNAIEKRKAQQQAAAAQVVAKVVPVSKGTIDYRVRLNGFTSARNFAEITAPRLRGRGLERGMNLLKMAPAGSFVKKGEIIAELDAQTLRDRIDDEQDTLKQRENDLKKKKVQQELDMENLRQSLRVAKSEMDKARLDARISEVRTDIDRELLRLAVEESEARYKQLSTDLAQQELSQKADLRITEISFDLQKRDVDKLLRDMDRFIFRAPMDGMVVMQTIFRPGGDQQQIQAGDTVNPGQPFMKIVDVSTMQVVGTVNQAESNMFRIGQQASVGLDAFPGARYSAKIYSIGALAAASGRQQYYVRNLPIQVQMLNVDNKVIPDLSASADVSLQQAKDVLVAPASAVSYENGKPVVYVKAAQGFERREVKVGLSDGRQIALLEGIREGEQVRYN